MAFTPEFLDEIRARVPLADVIGRRVRLKKRGREHSGLCPFHSEKTPSFTVSEDKGFYHCFGCGAHGDVIGFVMRSEGLSFPEAVERLAGEAGLPVPKASPEEQDAARHRADLLGVVEEVTGWFEAQLRSPAGAEARDYLARRGLDDATVAAFRLGFAPDRRGALRQAMHAKSIHDDRLAQAGLIKIPEATDGSGGAATPPRDYFFNRIIFPITDRRGRVIAFGGRALGDSPAKYLNSPDTPVFHKGRVLYNLSRARQAAHDSGELIVTEGYMDVIALAQAGFHGAVAPLGTAVTEQHLAEMWRLAQEPILCLDGDQAGRRAAYRVVDRALDQLKPGVSLRFALLPEGEDPDSLLQRQGVRALRRLLDGARPLADMLWLRETEAKRFDTPERRTALLKDLDRAAGQIHDEDLRQAYRVELRRRFEASFGYGAGARGGWAGSPRAPNGRQGRAWSPHGGSPHRGSPHGGWPHGGPPRPGSATLPRPVGFRSPAGLGHRREQVILATLINHPALLVEHAEDVVRLGLASADLRRLQECLIDLAAGVPDLDSEAIKCHLCDQGFSRVLDGLLHPRVYGHGRFARPEAPWDEVRRNWVQFVKETRDRQARAEAEQAALALADEMTEENLARLQAKQRLTEDGEAAVAGLAASGFDGPDD